MKDIFNRRQRFSLRKYSIGVCSVLLGTALFAAGAQSASADEAASESAGTAASEAAQPATTESSQEEATASKAYGEGAPVPKVDLSNSAATSETPAPATEKSEVAETPAATENKEAKAESKKEEKAEAKKSEETPKVPKAPTATSKPVEKKEASSKPASTTATTTAPTTSTRAAAGESSERAAAREEAAKPETPLALNTTVKPTSLRGTDAPTAELADAADRSASLDRAATDLANGGALATSRSRRGRRAATDHNNEPVAVATFLKDGEVATPEMTDPNGASVSSQTVPAGYQAKEGDFYTYAIWDLTKFNERYGTTYYARAYKRFDDSTDTTVELINKNTGAVVETRTITASSGVQKFTTTTAASNSQLTFQVDYKAGTAPTGKKAEPFIQNGYAVGKSITDLVASGHQLTPAEQALYTAVYNARTTTDILNVVEPAYNGRTITDSNAKIPVTINKTTYYKVVDKNNPTFNANKTDKTVQDYKENGNEVELARYTLKAEEGQRFTASGERQFDGYKLYQAADANDQSGTVSRPYTVGTKFMDADRYGIKRIKEIVGEDGSVVIRVYLLDPRQQSKRSDGSLSTDGYMLLAETKPIKPGEWNSQDLVVKKTPLRTISYTETNPKTGAVTQYPNGKEVPFDFQKASGYEPYHTVFVPFLGDGIGHGSANSQLERGVGGIGTNVDLLNTLTPYKQPVYYYVKQEPVEVTPEFEKQLEGRVLVDGEFTFKLTEEKSTPDKFEETVTNKDGKATFSKLTFTKAGTYKYKITEQKGSDTNVDYDAMTVTMTVTVTEKNAVGDLEASVKYSAEGGFKSSADDKVFNNYVVAPVKTKFDFSKALAGRELKEGEFTFVLKDADGKALQTKTNTKAGVVAFDDLTFDNTQVGTHKYTVEEVIPENKETGMTYDQMKAEVTITVTKEGHVLKATNTLPADTEFNNTFTPAATQAQFKFTKRLEGKELTKDAFTFELLENGNVIQTKKNAADGSITFDAIEYNAVGKHTYTVREKAGTDTNIDYDSMNAVVTVNVTKNAATGLLSAAVTMPEDTEFNNYVVSPVVTKFDFTKKLAGRKLAAGEFSFVLKDSTGREVETVKNDADGNVTFSELSFDNTKVGTHTYTVEEVIPANKEFGMTYDQMKATVTVEVAKNGHSLTTVTNVTSTGGKDANGNATDGTADKEFNNKVTPPETPEFQPEKFVVSKEKYDITGNKLMDDDNELTNEYTETNADPYVDKTTNNEPENLNTKTVKRGSKLVYQVWLDTTKFTEANNIQYVGVSDTYDAEKLDVNAADIKAYDSVTGAEVTNKFDIKVENGTITATSKEAFIKDKVNAPVIDTTKFEFGRYYKFDIPATVKESVKAGADIENTANQTVHVYNPVSKTVEKPEKPTQKRVNSVPVPVEMNFTKRLEGRELQKNEFEFVLKKDGVEVERVKNDAAGKIVFKTLEFGRDDLGKTYNYTVEETPGTDATVKYDTMVATVKVVVSHDGTAKAIVANVTDAADKEFNNTVTPPEEPKFQPEKYVVSKEKYDITGDKLVDDDRELADKYADTNANPYADDASNNEAENLNTKTVERGSKLVYQVWLDTTKFDAANKGNIQTVGISDNYDEAKLNLNKADIKAYDSVTGAEVTDKFDIAVNNGVITANLKAGFTKSLGDAENTQVIDTTKFAFGRYYKFDIPTTVKDDVVAGADIENTAAQVVNYYNPTTKKVEKPEKPTEKRVNNVPISVEFNFTKKLEGRELKANEFTFELKDSDNVVIATATNDASGNFKFTPVDYTNKAGKTVTALKYQKGQEGTYTYTVTEVKGTDSTVTYDTMAAVVTVKVSHDGTAKALITNVTEPADKEFNNRVTPPTEPKFQPEKYVVSKAKFDITGTKLVDDDSELTDKYGETNTNPYVDTTANNEDENLNTKPVERGSKLYYQVWLDTTKFDANNKDNIQTVGITDNYDKDKLTVNASDIKVYDSVTGADVTTKFDIADNNGVLTANLKDGFTKSLGDAENTQIIDTTKFEFGRYYKFDIPATVKDDVVAGADIENKAAQVVNYYNPVSKTVEKPNKPTEKRVNSVPISVEFNFTKKLEGRDLKAGEFTFELKDSDNVVIATATNDKAGKIKFAPVEYTNKAGKTVTALKYQKGQEGTYKYTVEEVKGSDATVTYDTMKAVVTVEVRHDGTAKALITNVTDPADKEFNNTVRPPEEPKFQPEKYVVSEEKFDITGDKLVDDDKELADKYADTNANPYADDASNNEKQNLNTKTVKRGDKLVYQVWLDTTKFDASNKDNIQSVGISDDYDETKLDLDSTKIKAYDSVTGAEVTDKFDIAV
ncbi:YSIRK-type signal peptide-containing protein, partial [Streptococcus parasanguinis]|uniref:Spy0128 family protein n=1 Tax=Streptococcus parasanguinis TaxID=1318 RepID=UPI001CBDED74